MTPKETALQPEHGARHGQRGQGLDRNVAGDIREVDRILRQRGGRTTAWHVRHTVRIQGVAGFEVQSVVHRRERQDSCGQAAQAGHGRIPVGPIRAVQIEAGASDEPMGHTRADLDPARLEERVSELMADEDVTRKSGVYAYALDGDERHLSIRAFDKRTQRAAYERQDGRCALCGRTFDLSDMHGDHIVPWSKGGHTTPDNCQMLCRDCNLRKGGR